ncbi:MAG: UDP-3-O-(3-hydroxymyristoyl)glucosamine N-acyltransferase [Bacteriovoracaceae bacterium]|jgi:UDP-3-O-[3-hydroxymyristoyl] glucosamine N-acyltransferase|nr:UDP-3-O-(3-hydroxymyristoyl)glucosamine N-acyltransferase [Bacteriovoracaceae bacterium]
MNAKDLLQYSNSLNVIQGENMNIEALTDLKALKANHLIFIKNKKFLIKFDSNSKKDCGISVIFDEKLWDKIENKSDYENCCKAILTTSEVDIIISKLSKLFHDLLFLESIELTDSRSSDSNTIHTSVQIGENCFIGNNVSIGEGTIIAPGVTLMGNIKIGENCLIYPQATIYKNVEIGNNARIHSGSVIGADGFGYNFKNGIHHKVWHMGGVIIGDDFEMGANSCVDQGTFSPTKIGNGVKLDNHCQIGHNGDIGNGVILCGHAGTAGTVTLGDFTVLGGYVAIGPGLELGFGCGVGGGGKVLCDWPANSQISGHPARPLKEWLRGIAWVRKESQRK